MMEQLLRNLSVILQLIFLEGILSVDNAMVLASLTAHLPKDKSIPLPKKAKNLEKKLDKWLGSQQAAALRVGLLGAYLGRGLMLFLATFIIENPWLRILGAIYLLKLAIEHLGEAGKKGFSVEEEIHKEMNEEIKPLKKNINKKGFWQTVIVVELSDLAFSLDNVVASVAISRHWLVVFLGVAIGILLMRIAAGWFVKLIEKEPILVEAAYLLILNIGIELIIEDVLHRDINEIAKLLISLITVFICWLYAHNSWLQRTRPLWLKISLGMRKINEVLSFNYLRSKRKA